MKSNSHPTAAADLSRSSSAIAEIINIPNANDYQNRPLGSTFNYLNINLAIIIATVMIILGVIIAFQF